MTMFLDLTDDNTFEGLMADLEAGNTVINPLTLLFATSTPLARAVNDAIAEKEEADRKAAIEARRIEKKAEMNADGFFWNNIKARFDCARCSGRGIIQHYRHVSGGNCFNCDGAGHRR
jgi:hypothetical protein